MTSAGHSNAARTRRREALSRADLGPIAIYVRTEYQHSPEAPAPSDAVRNFIALRDQVPEPPDVPVDSINRPRLLDAYIGVNLDNWQILVGKQSLSMGSGAGRGRCCGATIASRSTWFAWSIPNPSAFPDCFDI